VSWTVTLKNQSGAVAWTGDFQDEESAVVALENAEVAAREIKGRAEMDPPKALEPQGDTQ
jgi:hypothetical protein